MPEDASSELAPSSGRDPKFAICNELFRDWSYARACNFVAELGYRGLEIAPFTILDSESVISDRRTRELRQALEQAGLATVGLHWLLAQTSGLGLTDSRETVRRQTAEHLAKLAELCRELGGSIMVLGSPQQRNLASHLTPELGLEYAADCLERVLPVLEQQRVTLAIEPLAASETNFLNTAAETMKLIDPFESPWIQLHLDVKAMSAESTPIPELIRRHRAALAHFHANDPNLQGPGMGAIDFVPILRALQAIEYPGWISVEVFDESPGPQALARQSIDNLQRDWAAARA